MSARRHWLLALTLVVAAAGCAPRSAPPPAAAATAAAPIAVQGTVNYRQRVALPPTAVVRVQLLDVARGDAPARVLAEQAIATQGGQAPFAFALRAPAAAAAPPARLALQARIEVDGQLRFINTATVPVAFPPPARPIEVMVQPAP